MPGGPLAPANVDGDGFWAPVLHEVLATGRSTVVTGLARALPDGRLGGAGPLRPGLLGGDRHDEAPFDTAVVLPLGTGVDRPAGVLVAGVSAYLPLDDEYRAFLELVEPPRLHGDRRGGRLRRAAAARRAPHRAGPHQDGVLRRDQRPVPHTAEPGPRPGRGAARRGGARLGAARGPGAGAPQRAAPAPDGRPAAGALPAVRGAGRPAPRARRPGTARPPVWSTCSGRRSSTPACRWTSTARTWANPPSWTARCGNRWCPALLAHTLAVASGGRITVRLRRENGTAVLRVAATGATRVQPEDGGVGLALRRRAGGAAGRLGDDGRSYHGPDERRVRRRRRRPARPRPPAGRRDLRQPSGARAPSRSRRRCRGCRTPAIRRPRRGPP